MGKAENYVEGYLVDQCDAYDILCFKFISGHNGVPDRICIGNGLVRFIETKSKTGQPTPLQRAIHRMFARHGVTVYVPHTREEIDELIIPLKQRTEPLKQK